uniref:Zinc finger protein 165 n=1 Tax=Suricata suricatta TaxID=37032 RepID=A0A673TFN6_SURSU
MTTESKKATAQNLQENSGLLIVKIEEEDFVWRQDTCFQRSDALTQELCRKLFRQFCYQDSPGPREALHRLRELCRQWLSPEIHTKEQILELLVLEQFLTILPAELQARVQEQHPESGEEVVAALEDLERGADDSVVQVPVFAHGQEILRGRVAPPGPVLGAQFRPVHPKALRDSSAPPALASGCKTQSRGASCPQSSRLAGTWVQTHAPLRGLVSTLNFDHVTDNTTTEGTPEASECGTGTVIFSLSEGRGPRAPRARGAAPRGHARPPQRGAWPREAGSGRRPPLESTPLPAGRPEGLCVP